MKIKANRRAASYGLCLDVPQFHAVIDSQGILEVVGYSVYATGTDARIPDAWMHGSCGLLLLPLACCEACLSCHFALEPAVVD